MKLLRALFFGLLLLLLVTGIALAFSWNNASVSVTPESEIVTKIKAEHLRVCGEPLVVQSGLTWAARYKAQDMGYHDKMAHPLSDGRMIWEFYNEAGISWPYGAGEIVAWNTYPDDQTASVAFNGWMNSPGHRAIIQNCDFDHFGVGAFKTKDGGTLSKWYAAEFTNVYR